MSEIRKLPGQEERVETGPTQFGEKDFPGTFIRGGDSFNFKNWLTILVEEDCNNLIARFMAKSLINLLGECEIKPPNTRNKSSS